MIRLFIAILTAVVLTTPFHAGAAERNVLTEAQVRRVVTDYLLQKTGHLGVEIRLKRLSFSGEVLLPAGSVSFEVVSPREWEGWGRGALALIVRVNDQVEKNIPLNAEVEALADMVVTTRPLELGTVVTRDDLALQKGDLAMAPARVCRSLDEALGKRVRVGMRGNSPVRGDYLEKPPLVKSGQLVTIIAESDTFRVTASARAKGNGAAGETVLVQNLNAQKDMPALVVDANTVRVEF
jgi:flagella basal body P-ring formation protein FlgA